METTFWQRNKWVLIFICVLGAVLSECSSSKTTTTSTVVSAGATRPPVDTIKALPPLPHTADIVNGKTIYESKCYSCHDLPHTADYNPGEWLDIMDRMSRKAHLSSTENDNVTKYVCAKR